MEQLKSFKDLAREQGITIEPWIMPKEMQCDFAAYMKVSIQQSQIAQAEAVRTSKYIRLF